MRYALLLTTPHEKSITIHNSLAEAEEEARGFLLDTYIAGQAGKYIHDPLEKLETEYLLAYFDGEITYEIIPMEQEQNGNL